MSIVIDDDEDDDIICTSDETAIQCVYPDDKRHSLKYFRVFLAKAFF